MGFLCLVLIFLVVLSVNFLLCYHLADEEMAGCFTFIVFLLSGIINFAKLLLMLWFYICIL